LACEETCCAGWAVPVDEAHYESIRDAMSGSEAERAEFARAFAPRTDARTRSAALIVLGSDSHCTLLDAERMCSLQKRYGEAVLPDICAAYPRVASRTYDRIEVSGSLSCPEMARLCLLHEDATEIIDLDPQQLGRLRIFLNLEAPQDLYEAAFEDVRRLALHFLAQRNFPMQSRLFFLALFAHQSRPLLHREGGREEGLRLSRMLGEAGNPEMLDHLHRKFSSVQIDGPFAFSVVTQLLAATRRAEAPGYHRMVGEVLSSYAAEDGSGVRFDEKHAPIFDPDLLQAAFGRRLANVPASLLPRIDLYFENFCTNFMFKDWYLRAPNLLRHVMSMLVRVATLRFLLISHPEVAALKDLDPSIAATALDKIAVRVFYTTSRAVDHAEQLLKAVQQSLTEQGMETISHAISLIQL
jgi:lysine-N-methylase